MLHLLGCPKEADPRNETCDCARLRETARSTHSKSAAEKAGDTIADIPAGPDYKREYEASHVLITVPDDAWHIDDEGNSEETFCGPGWRGCFGIVLDTGNYVWVQANYQHGQPKGTEVIKRGILESDYHDRQGNLILAVPAEWCKFYTPEEAQAIEHAIEADHTLMRYAR